LNAFSTSDSVVIGDPCGADDGSDTRGLVEAADFVAADE